MKALKLILISLCIIFALLAVAAPFVSSFMQGYYKGEIAEHPENTQHLLGQKQLWAEYTDVVIITLAIAFVIMLLILLLIKRFEKNRKTAENYL